MDHSDVYFGYGKPNHRLRKYPAASQKGRDACQQSQSNSSIALKGHPTQQGALPSAAN